jgi:hypothetical protein
MVVTLPIATIRRILDRVTILPEQASEFILAGGPGPRNTRQRRDEQSKTDDKSATKAP